MALDFEEHTLELFIERTRCDGTLGVLKPQNGESVLAYAAFFRYAEEPLLRVAGEPHRTISAWIDRSSEAGRLEVTSHRPPVRSRVGPTAREAQLEREVRRLETLSVAAGRNGC